MRKCTALSTVDESWGNFRIKGKIKWLWGHRTWSCEVLLMNPWHLSILITPFKSVSVVLCYLKILCKICDVLEECKNSGMCFSSAVTVSSCHLVQFVHQIWFWWDRLSKPYTSLCQKQWSPSPLLLPFILPSMCWLQYWFGLWASRFSSLNWLETDYFKKSIVILPIW